MTKLDYTFKTDILFKTLFVQYPDLLKQLVSELLQISLRSIDQFIITNPEIPPDSLGDKFCRLDINMTVNGQHIDLEIQIENEKNYPERVLYYWAREYSSSLPSGKNYKYLPRTIIVSIIDFLLFDCSDYHSEFQPLEITRHESLSDKMTLHFFELRKLPKEINADNKLLLWLSLFKAETVEELEKIKSMEVPVMEQAINAYYIITAESEFREKERLWSKARHDEAQALSNAEEKGEERANTKWQSIVADKDAEIALLRSKLGM
ncbi:MAG: Rpn family recombination-promoting nuclease/putative transposase [Treponema sp.]|nr:Rpn family recombination-promoting nuclease/putative transposase [Treponema sp.]